MEALIFILKNDLLDFFTIERYRAATVWARPALKCLPEQPQKRSAAAPTPKVGRVRKAATPRRLPLTGITGTLPAASNRIKNPAGAATRRISGRRRATNRLRTVFASSGQCSQFRLACCVGTACRTQAAYPLARGMAANDGCRSSRPCEKQIGWLPQTEIARKSPRLSFINRPRCEVRWGCRRNSPTGPPIRPDPLRGLGAGSPTEPPAALRSRSCAAERLRTRAGTRWRSTRRMLPWAQPDQDANI